MIHTDNRQAVSSTLLVWRQKQTCSKGRVAHTWNRKRVQDFDSSGLRVKQIRFEFSEIFARIAQSSVCDITN